MPYVLTWLVFTVVLLIVILGSLALWLAEILNPASDTFDLEAGRLAQDIIYSPYGLGAVDELTGRPLPGIIDGEKLNDIEKLEQQLLLTKFHGDPNKVIAAKITINKEKPVELFYNEDHYGFLEPRLGARGASSALGTTISILPLVREDGVDTPYTVQVHVLRLRES